MQFDVVIGNPPYQLSDGGGDGTSARPIYNKFVEQAKLLGPRYLTMVIPSRWFTGGKGLDEFRESMLSDERMRSLDDYIFATDVFPNVALKGGVCYFLWDQNNRGKCKVTTHFSGDKPRVSERLLMEPGSSVFIRFNEGLDILKKVIRFENGGSAEQLALPSKSKFDQLVSTRKPYGLSSTFKGRTQEMEGDLKIYRAGGSGYVARSEVTNGEELIDHWKVFIGFAAPGTGNKDTYPHKIISTPFIGRPEKFHPKPTSILDLSPTSAKHTVLYLTCLVG